MSKDSSSSESLTQGVRDEFSIAIENGDFDAAKRMLAASPALSGLDLRESDSQDKFTNGFPLFRACKKNDERLAVLLLECGADPNSASGEPEDHPEYGMPLHFSVELNNFRLANILLDYGANPNSFPNCDKATIEQLFYKAQRSGIPNALVRRAYAKFLPVDAKTHDETAARLVGDNASEEVLLFARMVDLGAQPPFTALVREPYHDLLFEIIDHSKHSPGTPHDHPNASVISNIAGAARWYGYPKLVRKLMENSNEEYCYESALSTIGVAIASHNRDGDYSDYREIIVMQLEWLDRNGLKERALADEAFQPFYHIATDFTWHENYGYRAKIAEPECYVDLAELFHHWGKGGINFQCADSGHSPLSAAVKRGHHPGISIYVQWLLDNGADLRESDTADVNPIEIAKSKGNAQILEILTAQQNK